MDKSDKSDNDEMWELGNQFDINIEQTATYSP